MKLEFWGAAQTVTGSMHLINYNGKRILLDCGLYQGKRKDAYLRNREFPFDASSIDLVILSHAHIDHSGNLPSLVNAGFTGPIYCTSATRDLCGILLVDSAKIQESDVKYVNKRRVRDGQTPFQPLYVMEDAIKTLKHFRSVEFNDLFCPLPGLTVRFHVAGHMLGAATVELNFARAQSATPSAKQPTRSGEAEACTTVEGSMRLVFSGDIGRDNVPILQDPETVAGADYLIMEATYGNRLHEKVIEAEDVLLDAMTEVFKSRGRLIIPAFSVGRTQEILFRMRNLYVAGKLPPMRVFVDSPLAVDATDIYRAHADCFDEEMRAAILDDEGGNPLTFEGVTYIRRVEDSKAINFYKDPCVIISASGMCEGGRVLHHLKNNIEKPDTIVMFAGYQAPDTLGRLILDQNKKEIKIYGETFKAKAQVRKLEGCSGHSDQSELLQWARETADQGKLKQIFLVHCELEPATEFKQQLRRAGLEPVVIPARGDEFDLVF
jgi:metallo-beta-lactamase family protein